MRSRSCPPATRTAQAEADLRGTTKGTSRSGFGRDPDGRCGRERDPVPSPTPVAIKDGEPWIAYSWPRPTDGQWAIFLMRPDGTDAHEIAADVPGGHKSASWSPDGRTLAFVVQDGDHPGGSIWTANADGSGAALLSAGGTECPVGLFHPSWSPDGRKLAVVCYPGGPDAEGIAILDVTTKSITRFFTVTHPEAIDNQPSWSPDGKSIAFDVSKFDPTNTFLAGSLVATITVEDGKVHRLTSFDTFMAHPDWSPDGSEIAISKLGNGSQNLYAFKPDGTGLRQLTHSSVDDTTQIACPRWDPDGSRLVVCVKTRDAIDKSIIDARLGFVDANGGEPVPISQTDGKYPDLRPTP